jgi:uncharacterized protein
MVELRQPPSNRAYFVAYYLFAAVAWRATGFIFGSAPTKRTIDGLAMLSLKAALWIVPAIAMARVVLREPLGPCLGLTAAGRPVRLWAGIAVGVVFLALTTGLQMLISGRSPNWSAPVFPALILNAVNAVIEEISFRGFMLRQLEKRHPFWRANWLQVLLFLVVHWAGWSSLGLGPEMVAMTIGLTLLGLVLGWVARLSGSVWLGVVVHTANNFFASRLS